MQKDNQDNKNLAQQGFVWLVGAGPGDFGLITLNGLEAIQQAEVLVYDRLINEDLIAEAPEDCEKIYVGKQAANHALPQPQINELLYQKAAAGKRVVRLKGGDPYVFGRGGEEGLYLAERGIAFEVVPGITSSIAGPAYAGIPVTHRECASSFHVFTGNFKDDERGLDFANLARLEGTLIFLMGFANLNYITQGLLAAGKAADTPAAVISQAATPRQRTAVGTLSDIEAKVAAAGLTSPAITVIGQVVNCRSQLNFFEPKLAEQARKNQERRQKGVLILRDPHQSNIFAQKLMNADLYPLAWPVISIEPFWLTPEIKAAIDGLADYTWVVFTSPNGVEFFMDNFYESGSDWRAFGHLKFAAIGRATAEVLRERAGVNADFVPQKQVSDALGQGLAELLQPEDNVLLPRSAIADNRLYQLLNAKCPVTDLKIYDTHFRTGDEKLLRERLQRVGYVPFTSGSTVEGFVQACGGAAAAQAALAEAGCQTVAIGPVTAQRMAEFGLEPDLQAAEHSLDGIIEVILQDLQQKEEKQHD